MKFERRRIALIPFACLALTACDLGKAKEAKAPAGQVVATVDGEEITARELRAELQGMSFPSPQARKSAEQAALQSIIDRKLLAKAAEEAKLDETPDFALQKALRLTVTNLLQRTTGLWVFVGQFKPVP